MEDDGLDAARGIFWSLLISAIIGLLLVYWVFR